MDRLKDLIVLVTRPIGQQQALCNAIDKAGGKPVHLPLLDIVALTDAKQSLMIRSKIQNLEQYQLAIFVSTNAARLGAQWIDTCWPQFPAGLSLMAIGSSTAETLANLLGQPVSDSRGGIGSEDFLSQPEFDDVNGKKVAIFRGKGGRELLAETLRNRGAQVDYIELYERNRVDYTTGHVARLVRDKRINALVVTSGESLAALQASVSDNKEEICLLPLLVPSERIARQAIDSGFNRVVNTRGAGEEAIIAALGTLWNSLK
jgi:uroporphyrinogen-III synthase